MTEPGARILPMRRALRFVWDSAPGWTATRVALICVQGVLPLAALYVMKLIVDAVATGIGDGGAAASLRRIVLLVVVAAAVAIVTLIARSIAQLVTEAQALVVTDYVQDVLHEKSVAIDLEYYENPKFHDTLHRAQLEAPIRPTRIVNGLAQLGQNAVSLVAMGGLLISFHWVMAAIVLLAALPAGFARLKYSRRAYHWLHRQTQAQRKARYFNFLLTGAEFAKELRLFGLGTTFRDRFRALTDDVRKERIQLARTRTIGDLIGQLAGVVAMFASFGFIAWRTVNGAITLGDMVMYFGAFQRGQDFFREMLTAAAGLHEDNLFLADLETFLSLEPRVREPASPKPVPRPIRHGIVLEDVSFRYPGSDDPVLNGIDLEIRPGEHVALVGENGSGKTTLVKLLCRLYDPTGGSIRIDGIDLRELRSDELRGQIGVIFQDYVQYHLTALENIGFGNAAGGFDRERIVAAARYAGADEVVSRLRHGYDTYLGKRFGDGAELSIGQWQKIAIARAFMRDSQLIVMDEPTSALDPRAEYEVFERFHELAAGRSAVLVSHRLSTVRMADRIYVLSDGRVVERGSHEELVLRGGMYAHLFETQASHYR